MQFVAFIQNFFSSSRQEQSTFSFGPILIYMVVFLAIGAIHIFLDPFDLGKSAALRAQDVVMLGLLGPNYGRWKEHTDQVTVVRLNDRSLGMLQWATEMVDDEAVKSSRKDAQESICSFDSDQVPSWRWPLSMTAHAVILQAIQQHSPKAIFVDILFVDQRPGDGVEDMNCLLAQSTLAVEDARAKGSNGTVTEIFFASPKNMAMRADLFKANCDTKTSEDCDAINARLQRFKKSNVLPSPKKPEEGALRSYAASVELPDGEGRETRKTVPTAAFELLRRADMPSPWRPYGGGGPLLGNPTFDLEIIWGTEPNYINKRWMSCRTFDYSVWRWLWYMLSRPTEAFTQTCPYIATIPVEALLSPEPDWDIRALLENRIVFYGVDLQGASDMIYPSVHERLAGVYMHAMAMDNLLTYGPDYIRRLESHEDTVSFGALILIALIYFVFACRSQYLEGLVRNGGVWTTIWMQVPNLILYCIISWAVLVLYGYLMFLFLRAAPFNWLSAFTLWLALSASWFFQLFARRRRR